MIERMTLPTVSSNPAQDCLVELVRAALSETLIHPEAVDVSVSGGRLTLSGAVLQRDHPRLIRRLRAVPGVTEVEDDHLAVYASADGVSALQGGSGVKKRGALILTLLGTAAALFLRTGKK
jgi:hypothetical protein